LWDDNDGVSFEDENINVFEQPAHRGLDIIGITAGIAHIILTKKHHSTIRASYFKFRCRCIRWSNHKQAKSSRFEEFIEVLDQRVIQLSRTFLFPPFETGSSGSPISTFNFYEGSIYQFQKFLPTIETYFHYLSLDFH
jgi:hypothetical protein